MDSVVAKVKCTKQSGVQFIGVNNDYYKILLTALGLEVKNYDYYKILLTALGLEHSDLVNYFYVY